MPNKKDLVGITFHDLTVIHSLGHRVVNDRKRRFYLVRCKCGTEFDVEGSRLPNGQAKSCKTCKYKKMSASANSRWRGFGEISGNYWDHVVRGARSRDFIVDVTIEDAWLQFLKQERKCALSGIVLEFAGKCGMPKTASFDRIDSTFGYIQGNVQWLHKDINRMKQNFDEYHFLDLCRKISEHQRT